MTKVEKLKSEVLSFEPPCPKCDLGYSGVVCNCTNPAMVDAVDGLIQAARDEVLDSSRPCCSAKCRNKEVACTGELELHWVCSLCGHEHHATIRGE